MPNADLSVGFIKNRPDYRVNQWEEAHAIEGPCSRISLKGPFVDPGLHSGSDSVSSGMGRLCHQHEDKWWDLSGDSSLCPGCVCWET